jgi:hypothetical protein
MGLSLASPQEEKKVMINVSWANIAESEVTATVKLCLCLIKRVMKAYGGWEV